MPRTRLSKDAEKVYDAFITSPNSLEESVAVTLRALADVVTPEEEEPKDKHMGWFMWKKCRAYRDHILQIAEELELRAEE